MEPLFVQKISNYGSTSPAIARTYLQGEKIISAIMVDEPKRQEAKGILFNLHRHLLKCVEIRDRIESEINEGYRDIADFPRLFQNPGGKELPGITELQSRAESFLQSAKLGVKECGDLFDPFYHIQFGHNISKLTKWVRDKFGDSNPYSKILKEEWEPWVTMLITMRNSVDHPNEAKGHKLITQNFKPFNENGQIGLKPPTWGLAKDQQLPIKEQMDAIIEGIIELGEDFLAFIFNDLKAHPSLTLYSIPEEKRDPSCPIRLRIEIGAAKVL